MTLKIIKKLPKRKKYLDKFSFRYYMNPVIFEGAARNIKHEGFNLCLDEIETVEVTEKDIVRVLKEYWKSENYSNYDGIDDEDLAKAIMKLGGGE